MIDFHCHLDLYKNPLSLLPEVEKHCEFVLAVTTSPRAWVQTSKYFNSVSCIHTAIGFHPELVQERITERELFLSSISKVKFVGEIGIDGTKENASSMPLQQEIFSEAIRTSEKYGGKVLSIHSRNATSLVLNAIEANVQKSIPILHWFSGTVKELDRAISMGCWFSVNASMLSGKKGVDLVTRMPTKSILPETDGPFITNNNKPYMPWETSIAIQQLANVYRICEADVNILIKDNLNRLLSST